MSGLPRRFADVQPFCFAVTAIMLEQPQTLAVSFAVDWLCRFWASGALVYEKQGIAGPDDRASIRQDG